MFKTLKERDRFCNELKNKSILQNSDIEALAELMNSEISGDNWSLKCKILDLMGQFEISRFKNPIYAHFIEDAFNYDLVTSHASSCYIRLSRSYKNDVKDVLFILEKTSSYSLKEGALNVLGYDDVLPNTLDQSQIISLSTNFGFNRPRGYTDPRYGLAAACYQWDKNVVNTFLEKCIESKDAPLKYVAENSLKRIKSKLR